MEGIGRKRWAIAEGYIPSQSSFSDRALLSHETACILNAGERDAHVAITIFFAALLVFAVQPLLGKLLLPWFGGSAAVWTACLMFFQVGLLAGNHQINAGCERALCTIPRCQQNRQVAAPARGAHDREPARLEAVLLA